MKKQFIGLIMLIGIISITGFAKHSDLTQNSDTKDLELASTAFDCADIQLIPISLTTVPLDVMATFTVVSTPVLKTVCLIESEDQKTLTLIYMPNIGYRTLDTAKDYTFDWSYMDKSICIQEVKSQILQNKNITTFNKPASYAPHYTYKRARDGLIRS